MLRKSLLALALSAAAFAVQAETLLLDGLDQAAPTASQRPTRGQTMEAVEARFGEPTSRVSPVGEPPISRWEYPGFTVYFEYDHVIHAVVRH